MLLEKGAPGPGLGSTELNDGRLDRQGGSTSLPVSTWGVAEWGMVAASWGMELISGSGVLLGGEIANGVITILGLSCRMRGGVCYSCIQSHRSLKYYICEVRRVFKKLYDEQRT